MCLRGRNRQAFDSGAGDFKFLTEISRERSVSALASWVMPWQLSGVAACSSPRLARPDTQGEDHACQCHQAAPDQGNEDGNQDTSGLPPMASVFRPKIVMFNITPKTLIAFTSNGSKGAPRA
jgi:hypothetical protein